MNVLKKSWHKIKENKLRIAALFLMQLVFFTLIAFINVKYQLQLAESANALIAPLQSANYNADSIQSGVPFLENIGQIYEAYQKIMSALKKLIGFQLAAFLTIGVLLWTLTQTLGKKINVKHLGKLYLHLLGRALVFIVPLFVMIYILLQIAFESAFEATGQTLDTVYIAVALFFIGMYFLIICLAQERKTIIQNTRGALVMGVKKIHYLLGILLIIAAAISITGYAIYFALEYSLILLTLSIILFVLAFVIGRIIFIEVVQS